MYKKGCKCRNCNVGTLEAKPKTKIKTNGNKISYFSVTYICDRCKSIFNNEIDRITVGSAEDLALRDQLSKKPDSNQTSLF